MSSALRRQPIPFGNYLLMDRINIGGMAEVWRAKTFGASGFERIIAIKRILPNIAEDEEFIAMFIDEAKITVQLNHANIGHIYELSHVGKSYYIAMEYVSGRDLRALFDRSRLRGERLPIPLVCYVIAKCCEGLDFAHRKKDSAGRDLNVVHRDVSPQNLLISYEGEVKVIDFGIAKAAGKANRTQAGILKGKFSYMSPEQIRGLTLDRRSDIFAIGICLYELLTGQRAFASDTDFSVLERVRRVELAMPRTYNPDIPEALERIVMKALAREVEDRFSYASELADELHRFVVTPESVFGRKDLAQFMRTTFAEDLETETQRLQDYAQVSEMPGRGDDADLEVSRTVASTSMTADTIPPVSSEPPSDESGLVNLPRMSVTAPFLSNGVEDDEATRLGGDPSPSAPPPPTERRPTPFEDEPTRTDDPFELPVTPHIGNNLPMAVSLAAIPKLRNEVTKLETTATSPIGTAGDTKGAAVTGSGTRLRARTMSLETPAPEIVTENNVLPWLREKVGLPLKGPLGWVAGAVGALLTLLLALWVFSPEETGLLLVDLPPEVVANGVRINVNGEELKPTSWPLLLKEPAGKTTVMIVANGYETLLETVEVKPGNEYTQLKSTLVKKP